MMKVRVYTVNELKEAFVRILMNTTDKISKVTLGSVVNAISYGIAKIGQKSMKDVAVVESRIFPDVATGEYLDDVASMRGIQSRLSEAVSSTYLRLVADPGTYYPTSTVFSGSHGINFVMSSDFTMGDDGYAYVKVRSVSAGDSSNVDPLSIINVSVEPAGHKYCINEYSAVGGRDHESDDELRYRVMMVGGKLASGTLDYLTNILIDNVNTNVLRLFHYGINSSGQTIIGVASVNGVDFTDAEIGDMVEGVSPYLSLSDQSPFGIKSSGISMRNIEYYPIDIDFRCGKYDNYSWDDLRVSIQVALSKLVDYRFWKASYKVEWDDMLSAIKNIDGIKYVPDGYFYPNQDMSIPINMLPRIRGFIMRDLDGGIIADRSGNLNTYYYPNE